MCTAKFTVDSDLMTLNSTVCFRYFRSGILWPP